MSKLNLHIAHYFTLSLFACLIVLSSCDTTVKTDNAAVGDAIVKKITATPSHTFVIDTTKSEITWIGSKMTGRHNGYFKIKEGELQMTNGLISGGTIVIDMTHMQSSDKTIDVNSNTKLTNHLKSPDFFDTNVYPTAVFELTGIAPYDSTKNKPQELPIRTPDSALRVKNPTHKVTGNLTLKGKTKSISFPAKVTMDNNLIKAKANFNIDRTQWGLVYRSDNSLGEKTIYPEVNIGLDIVAKPQAN
ncbi:YceI family protein [Pontibacter sp. MBLB2868]|uniref:YceI family protein n=1 Tax=Pontibacter sp. MBLB2868 TaxID=3451555 RepID=UPI003F755DA5